MKHNGEPVNEDSKDGRQAIRRHLRMGFGSEQEKQELADRGDYYKGHRVDRGVGKEGLTAVGHVGDRAKSRGAGHAAADRSQDREKIHFQDIAAQDKAYN